MTPEIVVNNKAKLGEGPVWDEQEQCLWWTDIHDGKIYKTDHATGHTTPFDIGIHVGTIGLREAGGLLLATTDGVATFNPTTQKLTMITNPESDKPNNRFNDGKPDPSGGFYFGSMSYTVEANAGAFYHLAVDGTVSTVRSDVTISNGLAWNANEDIMYYIDTPHFKVFAYDFDKETGQASNPRDQFSIDKEYGSPDGMTIDTEGMLWIAHYGGGAVRRWNPATGDLLTTIKFPATQTTCPVFGGPDFKTLYVTSAAQNLSEEDLASQPEAGALFKVETPYQGKPAYRSKL